MPDQKPTDAIPPSLPVKEPQATPDPAAEPSDDSLTFPAIVGLELGYNAAEDRVVMLARMRQSETRVVLLTRRMMGQLLGHYAELMRRTSPVAARAPSAQQNEVLQMEHVSALMSAAAEAPPANDPNRASTEAEAPQSVHLITEIRMQVTDSHLSIGFVGPQQSPPAAVPVPIAPIAAATMDRSEAHRFLALLNDKAVEAAWGLEGLCPWLTSAGLAPSAQVQVN